MGTNVGGIVACVGCFGAPCICVSHGWGGRRNESGNGRTDRCVMSVGDRRTTGDGERVA